MHSQGLPNLLANATVPAAPRPRTRAGRGAGQRPPRRPYKRTPLTEEQRVAIIMAVCRVAGATELKVTHLQLKVVKAAHELLKKGNILAGVPPSGSWLAKKHATTVIRYWVKQLARGRMGFKAQRKPRRLACAGSLSPPWRLST